MFPAPTRGDPKRPRTADHEDNPSKRARNSGGSGDPPHKEDEAPSDVVHLQDRSRFSWISKAKWRAKTPRSTSVPLSRGLPRSESGCPASHEFRQAMSVPLAETIPANSGTTPPQPTISPVTVSEASLSEQQLALQAEIIRLRRELEDKNKVISRHDGVLDTIRTSMQCGICYEPFIRPCAVVPCGHISCQNCLIEWFNAPADPELPPDRHKRKTCPHCRTAVRSRPVEIFGLAPAAAALSGHLDPSAVVPAFGSAIVAADPWAAIFPVDGRAPLRDEEDGVLRCPDCFHEVFDGECVRCGRLFSDEDGHSVFGSDDGSISIYGDGIESNYGAAGSLYAGSIFGGGMSDDGDSVYGSEDDFPPQVFVPRAHIAYDSYEDEDDDDSFIDDSELPHPPPAAYFDHYAPSESEIPEEDQDAQLDDRYRSPLAETISSDSEDDEDSDLELDEGDDFLPGGRRGLADMSAGIETAEEADDEDDGSVDPNATLDLDPDEDDDDDAPVRPMGRRVATASWGWNPGQVAPARRSRRIESPDGSESEYFSE